MKKFIYSILAVGAFLFASCNENTDLWDESPSERISASIKADLSILTAPENGWVLHYYPSRSKQYGGYNVWLKFNKNGEVTAATDLLKADSTATSLYQLRDQSGVTLTFDTFNAVFHTFSTPKNTLGIGSSGLGMEGDAEFVIRSATKDRIEMVGKKTNNLAVMTPVPVGKTWTDVAAAIQTNEKKFRTKKFYYVVGTDTTLVTRSYRTLTSVVMRDGERKETKHPYIITDNQLQFDEPVGLSNASESVFTLNSDSSAWISNDKKAKIIPVLQSPAELFMEAGPLFISYQKMSTLMKLRFNNYYDKIFVNDGAPLKGDSFNYLVLGKLLMPAYYSFNFITTKASPTLWVVTPSQVSQTEIGLALTFLTNADFAYFPLLLNCFADYPAPMVWSVEPNDPISPTEFKLINQKRPTNWFIVSTEETPLGK